MLYFDENASWISFIKACFTYYDDEIFVIKIVSYFEI